ncbi:fimbrial protein [Burkholderia ubonensis]|uniref:Fimbrial protein n=1 Tax=Burkholderia ubonensis TaxID=101571 RepID=A0ABD4DZ72_9BURK|nr:fimbrial protein [Burkholderia ubonensis]KVN81585.1 fimbrial protein [Burkholderia ubonensis]KVO23966.1 fimbrial protein [Burkholderia ubonensis]KVO88909.1 fimbrial protein [Burkholderia ubonensis]KVQ72670.1 fimbrial protein [Burkholderia ubonensis]KVR03627.1 fimbrial protein [Burkholderia ubonensis]
MKKYIVATAISVSALMPLSAYSADGTLTFAGTLSGASCTIKVNNAGSDATVQLPTVGAGLLASQGAVAGATNFTIALSACTGTAKSVRAYFEAGPNVNAANGTLVNRAATSPATNVAVQLLGMDGKALKAGDPSQRDAASITLADNAATMVYGAQYYALGKATAGAVSTSVTYSIEYL